MIQNTAIGTEALAAKLRSQVRGEVRFDEGSRALYATDSSNYRQVSIGVVIPRDVDDVTNAVSSMSSLRSADNDTLVIADGFSCREQITQLTGRRTLHLAKVIQMAISSRSSGGSR